MRLDEKLIGESVLLESDRSKLPNGVLCRVKYPISTIGKLNANKRVYSKDVWERVLSNPELKEKMEKRALFGHAEHPATSQSDLQLTSHVIFETVIDGDTVYQTFDVVDTPCGRIVDTLLRAGCKVGCSTRAEGELSEASDKSGNKFFNVVPGSYKYITTDMTADPSTFGSVPVEIQRNVVTEIKSELSNKSASEQDKKFANAILESMKVKEGVVTATVDPVSKSVSVAGDVNNVVVTPASTTGVESGMVNVMVATAEPAAPPVPANGVPVGEEPEEPVESEPEEPIEEPVEEPGESDEIEPEPEPGLDNEEEDEDEEEKDKIPESKIVASIASDFIALKITEATVRAERDRLIEEVDRFNSLHTQYRIAMKKLSSINESDCSEVNSLRTVLESKSSELSVVSSKLANAVKINDDLKTKIDSLTESIVALKANHAKVVSEMKKSNEKAIAEAKTSVVRQYANSQVKSFGKVHANVQALLENCMTIKEVDDIISEYRDSRRRNALHSVNEVKQPKEVAPKSDIAVRVGTVFEGMGL